MVFWNIIMNVLIFHCIYMVLKNTIHYHSELHVQKGTFCYFFFCDIRKSKCCFCPNCVYTICICRLNMFLYCFHSVVPGWGLSGAGRASVPRGMWCFTGTNEWDCWPDGRSWTLQDTFLHWPRRAAENTGKQRHHHCLIIIMHLQ